LSTAKRKKSRPSALPPEDPPPLSEDPALPPEDPPIPPKTHRCRLKVRRPYPNAYTFFYNTFYVICS
jgi:hypothetical protein